MRLLKAHRCRALLLVLLLGFTALTLHASMHTQPDQQSCELCSGHAKPSHAVAPAAQTPIRGSSVTFKVWFHPQIPQSEAFTSYRQRAPPVPS
jgi:hypothetical protein